MTSTHADRTTVPEADSMTTGTKNADRLEQKPDLTIGGQKSQHINNRTA